MGTQKLALEQTAGADTATGTHKLDVESILQLRFGLLTFTAHGFKEAEQGRETLVHIGSKVFP